MHLLMWLRNRAARAGLLLSLISCGIATLAWIELSAMKAQTVSRVASANRWAQVPVLIILVSLVLYVRVRLRAGRPWLAWIVSILRAICLLPAFLCESFNFRHLISLRPMTLFGERISIPQGITNPWMLIGQLSLVLCLVYVADAMWTVWQRGNRDREGMLIGGSIFLCLLTAGVQSALSFWQIVDMPPVPSLFFLVMLAMVAYDLSRDAGRAAQLAADLRQSNARMALTAEATGVGVWQWSIAADRIWGSEKWLSLFGLANDKTITFETIMQRVHPADRAKVDLEIRRAVKDLAGYQVDFRVMTADGNQRWVMANGKVQAGSNGEPSLLMGTTIDLTDRKLTELALGESEERFRALAESALVGIYIIVDGKYTYVNPTMARIFGYSVTEMVGMNPLDIVQPCDHALVRECIRRRIMAEVDALRYEFEGRCKDGSTRNIEVYGTRVELSRGRALVGTLLDITDHKRAVAAIRASEQRFLQVSEAAGRFIWEVDATGMYTYVSPSVEKILGYTPDELVGEKHFFDLFIPSACDELKAVSMRIVGEKGTLRDFANANLTRDGATVHLETSGSPVLDPSGQLIGYRGANTDVTERRQTEIENERHRNELAHIARVATMGQLASSLAHELNQPLGAILRNAEAAELYLQDPSPDLDEIKIILEDIRLDDKRAGDVIDRMRALMKRRQLERRRLDLGELVNTCFILIRPDAEKRRVRLMIKTSTATPAVMGDHVQLQQVLINLVINAMDAMEQSNAADRVVMVESATHGSEVHVTVRDNGPGVPSDKLPHIFEPFYTSKPNGLGMGLPIAKDIIEAHQGRLWAYNDSSGGATFAFALPIAD